MADKIPDHVREALARVIVDAMDFVEDDPSSPGGAEAAFVWSGRAAIQIVFAHFGLTADDIGASELPRWLT